MGRKRRRKNATLKKRWYKKLYDHWSIPRKQEMKLILGKNPNTVKPVTGTIDGRDWRTYFPAPPKSSGFSWLEFTQRIEAIQHEKNAQMEKEKNKLRNRKRNEQKSNNSKGKKLGSSNENNDIVMKNPYKTVNNNNNSDNDDDE
eukprot:732382_1